MNANQLPGVGNERSFGFRRLMLSGLPLYLPGGVVVDGSKSRDPLNTGDVHTLRAGMLMGKITATKKWAPSILGLLTAAYANDAGTTLTVSAATAAEIVRRIGTSGTFKITGPATAGGTVRTLTVTYSAVNTSTGAITITALGTDIAAVNDVQTMTLQDGADGGTVKIKYGNAVTDALAFNVAAADLQTAVRSLHDDLAATVVSTVGGVGVDYVFTTAGVACGDIEIVEDMITDGGVLEPATILHTTQGVAAAVNLDGRQVAGALIQPTDGSETIRGILGIESGLKVTDDDEANIDVACNRLVIGSGDGVVSAAQILNYSSEASLKAYIKVALRAVGQSYVFDDDFIG